MATLRICFKCRAKDHGLPPCNGECRCPIDERGLAAHVQEKWCPDGKFSTQPWPSRIVIWALRFSGARAMAERLRWYDPKDCSCQANARRLDRLVMGICNIPRWLWDKLRRE
jgi:hypothetical protein